jgi:rod shape-determining protein MreC
LIANINKGKTDGIYVGQPVIDAHGLFGQVTLVGPKFSKVLLVTDVKSAIPVTIVRNGVQAIATGTGDGIELINISETIDIKEGDFLVTSGMGQRFPAGYAVGVVQAIKRVAGERFMKVLLTPSAHIKSSRNVLLIWSNPVMHLKSDKK